VRPLAALALLAGCGAPPAPDEVALERYHAANRHYEEGRWAEAVPHYEFVISARERLKDAYHRLAWCQERLGREAEAVTALEKLRRVDRQDEYALRHLWRLYVHRGFVDEALEAARELLRLYPGDPGLREEVARLEGWKGAAK
jgi:tetratricopeptide (TPR) repeat protein